MFIHFRTIKGDLTLEGWYSRSPQSQKDYMEHYEKYLFIKLCRYNHIYFSYRPHGIKCLDGYR